MLPIFLRDILGIKVCVFFCMGDEWNMNGESG